jgi:uncharacterized protein YueI
MSRTTVDDYLQEGIYGKKEIKPEERKRYLGTLRERVIAVLSQSQVREKTIYPEIEQLIKDNPNATILLNGAMQYSELAKYITLASRNKAGYKIVANKMNITELGLVIANDTAIDKETITIDSRKKAKAEIAKKRSVFSKLANMLKKKR